jgi:hypothetical protein
MDSNVFHQGATRFDLFSNSYVKCVFLVVSLPGDASKSKWKALVRTVAHSHMFSPNYKNC